MPMRARWQCRGESDAVQHQSDIFNLLHTADDAMCDGRLADDVQHAHPWIERRIRILEDHLHLELQPTCAGRVEMRERITTPEALAIGQWQEPGG